MWCSIWNAITSAKCLCYRRCIRYISNYHIFITILMRTVQWPRQRIPKQNTFESARLKKYNHMQTWVHKYSHSQPKVIIIINTEERFKDRHYFVMRHRKLCKSTIQQFSLFRIMNHQEEIKERKIKVRKRKERKLIFFFVFTFSQPAKCTFNEEFTVLSVLSVDECQWIFWTIWCEEWIKFSNLRNMKEQCWY